MQEINLLENRVKDTSQVWAKRNQLFMTIVVLVLILEIGLIAVFYLLSKNLDKQIQAISTENSVIQTSINKSQPKLLNAQSFQAQLKNVRSLLDSHIYWSGLFDELAEFTVTNASYANFKSNTLGEIHVEGVANSYTDLGKLILGLNTSGNFDNVKLLSVAPSTGIESGFKFSLDLVASQELFVEKK
jgi:Tfp pilus assembly protein PilN